MTWTVQLDAWETSVDITENTLSQGLGFTDNYVITAMKAWLVYVDTPTFCNMTMKVYGNDDEAIANTPTELLHTSTSLYSNGDICSDANGVIEVPFLFDEFTVRTGVIYNFVITADCYFPTDTSFIGWKKAYPDPVIKSGYIPTTINLNTAPYELFAYGAKL